MCLAILNKAAAAAITKKEIYTAWSVNSDGSGLMYVVENKLQIFKELYNKKKFFKEYSRVRKLHPKTNILIHFRYATAGSIDENNIHPFLVNENLGFIHNGIINIESSAERSDTNHFNTDILQRLPKEFLKDESIVNLISLSISGSKLVFLDTDNNYTIINEERGFWEGENWFSNTSHLCEYEEPNQNIIFGRGKDFWQQKDVLTDFCDKCKKLISEEEIIENEGYLCQNCYEIEKYEYSLNKEFWDE